MHDVGWGPAGDLGDRGGDGRCLPAPVVRVVLEQALDLPGRQDAPQALGEGVGHMPGLGKRSGGYPADVADVHCAGRGVAEIQLATLTA